MHGDSSPEISFASSHSRNPAPPSLLQSFAPHAVQSTKGDNGTGVKDSKEPCPLYQLPFSPYDVQRKMMRCISEGLGGKGKHARPLIVTEVPTGCGKTLALLSSVLQFQLQVSQLAAKEQVQFFKERQPPTMDNIFSGINQTSNVPCINSNADSSHRLPRKKKKETGKKVTNEKEKIGNSDQDSLWAPDTEFFRHFHRSHSTSATKRKHRIMGIDEGKSSALRRQFSRPPCTIFYCTRTHGQLHQVTKELRKLTQCGESASTPSFHNCSSSSCSFPPRRRSCPLRMNILASRDHYCIHSVLHGAKVQGKLPNEGNNLGEMCDKLVMLNQCPCVEQYDLLGCSAIDGQGIGFHKGDPVWDIEDLVVEGVATQKCPYYASRDLVFYADINLCTYLYLLDPVIRHECHFEGALKNYSIIIIDEAHNVSQVCEEVLSIQCSHHFFTEMAETLLPFIAPKKGITTVLTYPRDFKLSDGSTLLDIFVFLSKLMSIISSYFVEIGPCASSSSIPVGADSSALLSKHLDARDLVKRINQRFTETFPSSAGSLSGEMAYRASNTLDSWMIPFRKAYGMILSLGVTFNPFDFPLHILFILKRWLVVLRFVFQKPEAFALRSQFCSSQDGKSKSTREFQKALGNATTTDNLEYEIRCLDGSLAFSHLLRSAFRVILSSGTLTPFSQLSRSLGVPSSMWYCLEGEHVVPEENFVVHVLTRTHPGQHPLHCTFAAFSSDSFFRDLGETILFIACKSLKKGGAVVMVPNYQVLYKLWQQIKRILEEFWQRSLGTTERDYLLRLSFSRVFQEPRQSAELQDVLNEYKAMTLHQLALFIGVYRGKSGEGLDFSDDMARMVFCVGLPFRPITSWAVGAKKRYSGEAWYVEDAMCAVNQALGRCLRHKEDFGAMVLLDDRYCDDQKYQSMLSRWCRQAISVFDSAISLVESLQHFFERRFHLALKKQKEQVKSEEPSHNCFSQGQTCTDAVFIGSAERAHGLTLHGRCERSERRVDEDAVVVSKGSAEHLSCKRHRPREEEDKNVLFPRKDFIHEYVFSCTAVKLLYEQCDDTKEITPSALEMGVSVLQTNFVLNSQE